MQREIEAEEVTRSREVGVMGCRCCLDRGGWREVVGWHRVRALPGLGWGASSGRGHGLGFDVNERRREMEKIRDETCIDIF